ncbi:hypothetical protein NQ117_10410 [Paenibacillus sp. SC116]|uniref:hypothetical protein n=1 Tax=Paenibacillus sp. SC116 TaxID=2968986 RepID=UPI00215ABBDC|nr:hypothetical protein [Paenibacillus sp. SC116]MCR8844098.1 hypothetical protein [Paenibacillus sp. SC116]
MLSKVIDLKENETVKTLSNLIVIGLKISMIVTIVGFYFYLLGYSFLYGYYFSGNLSGISSITDLLNNPVPFNFYSVMIIAIFLLITVLFFYFLSVDFKNKKIETIFFGIIIFGVFHVCFSLFFVNGSDSGKVIDFLFVWVVPLFFVIFFIWLNQFSKDIINCFSWTLYGAMVHISFFELLKWPGYWNPLLLISMMFLFGGIFPRLTSNFLRRNLLIKSIVIFPFALVSCAFLFVVIKQLAGFPHIFNLYIITPISIATALIISPYLKPNKEIQDITLMAAVQNDTDNNSSNDKNVPEFLRALSQLERTKQFIFVLIVITFLMTIFPYTNVVVGKYIREITPSERREVQIIKDYEKGLTVEGNVISIHNNIYYISDTNWRLQLIKGETIHVERKPEE